MKASPSDLFGGTAAESMQRGAEFSTCRLYRYSLWRRWGPGPYAMFIGLNPSTADEVNDDPTIRRCLAFSKAWGFDAYYMTNIFAYRATDPRVMKSVADPGDSIENDLALLNLARSAGIVVAAWGTHGTYRGRGERVRQMLPRLHYLRLTKDGHPNHPLYLPASLRPVEWVS